MGTTSRGGSLPHDAAADLDGNLWFAAVTPNKTMTVGRIDAKTGEVKPFKVNAPNGNRRATRTASSATRRASSGSTCTCPRGALAKVDPKTEKVSVYIPPSTACRRSMAR